MNDRVQLRASALTLYTMLSIIPFAAIAFGIAKGFALDQKLQEMLAREFQTQPEVLRLDNESGTSALQETRGGYIAGIGIIILIWSVMSLLDQIEKFFQSYLADRIFQAMVSQIHRLSYDNAYCTCIPDPFKQHNRFCEPGTHGLYGQVSDTGFL